MRRKQLVFIHFSRTRKPYAMETRNKNALQKRLINAPQTCLYKPVCLFWRTSEGEMHVFVIEEGGPSQDKNRRPERIGREYCSRVYGSNDGVFFKCLQENNVNRQTARASFFSRRRPYFAHLVEAKFMVFAKLWLSSGCKMVFSFRHSLRLSLSRHLSLRICFQKLTVPGWSFWLDSQVEFNC